MFVIRGAKGEIVTDTEWGKAGEETRFATYEEAERALKEMELSIPKGIFRVQAIECDRCGGDHDLAVIHVNEEPKAYCQNCRVEMFSKKNPVGRPAVGVTRKVSLTLPEEEWEWLDEKAQGNRSQFLRHLVWNAQSPESEWSNYACLGYAIAGAEKLGYDPEQIRQLVQAIHGEFDWKSVPKAKDIYRESDY